MTNRMITIKGVASLAGVSKSTVSRVLNNNGYVSDKARSKVEEVIHNNYYSPSAAAISLTKRETNAIGIVVPELDNVFFSEVIKGIADICDENDFVLVCFDTARDAIKEDRALRMLAGQRVRGLILSPAQEYTEPEDINRLQNCFNLLNTSIVLLDRQLEKIKLDGVFYENFKSGYLAGSELIKAGNRQLGIITGDLSLQIGRERFQGFMQAVHEAGLTVEDKFILNGDFRTASAYKLSKEMFSSGCYPEGIVTCNNLMSLGFLKAARECNFEIGKDIAVIGIDNIQILDILGLNFSCVSRDTYEMGRVAMRLLCDRIENNTKQQDVQLIPCQLVLKGSERRNANSWGLK